MRYSPALVAALAAGSASAQETVLGVYIFSRHGDRTAKETPPTSLTDLGYEEVFTSGTYFRNRYIAAGASNKIYGMNTDLVKESQITASAPVDNVLQNSALAFLQGLYPPVGETLGSQTLRNGTVVQTPLNGYQLIPLQTVSTGSNSENSAWLQGATNCANAQISSDEFFTSTLYLDLLKSTQSFYDGVSPMINRTFTAKQTSFENAYTIFDLLNVASIHNASDDFPNAYLLTPETFFQLRTLADTHEFNLAYNESESIRAVTGSIIAAQVVTALNGTITGNGVNKLNIQFGAYGGMQSFFGLANLTMVNPNFFGVPDYASTLTWELVTNATVSESSFPSPDEISVRFLFHNGTTSNISIPTEYPLFGQGQSPLPWNDFVSGMNQFAIGNQADWCKACGNSTGVCSPASLGEGSGSNTSSITGSSSSTSTSSGSGISKAVAGVIGAMVTLGVILGIEVLIMLIGGYKLVNKKKLANPGTGNGAIAKA
jgi:Histidine phosphatase superfamily (branch 2)